MSETAPSKPGEGDFAGPGEDPIDGVRPAYYNTGGPKMDGGGDEMADAMQQFTAATDEDRPGGMQRREEDMGEGGPQYEEGKDEEDEYEDPEEMIREFGRHPMMDRVQEALYNQLLQTYERVSEELRDKNSDVKK